MVTAVESENVVGQRQEANTGSRSRLDLLGLGALAASLIAIALVIDIDRDDVFAAPKFRVASFGACVLLVLAAASSSRRRRRLGLVDAAVAAYVAWSLLAFALAPDRSVQWAGERFQFQGMASVLIYASLYVAGRTFIRNTDDLRTFSWWMLAGISFTASYAVLQDIDRDPIWSTLLAGRTFSTIGNPNTLGSVLVLGIPLAVWFVATSRGAQRAVAGSALLLIGWALLSTESRGGFLAAVVAIAVMSAVSPRPTRRHIEFAAAALLVAVAAVVAIAPLRDEVASTWDRAATALDPGDESRQFHSDGWRVTIKMVRDHPLLGVGHERFPVEFPAYRDEVLSPEAIARFSPYRLESPHNVPLAIAVAAGIPAAALYLSLVAMAVRRFAVSGVERWVLAGGVGLVTAHLVADLFVTADLTSAAMFWATLGALVAVAEREPEIDLSPE